jgi:hypothetical protein
MRNRCCGWAQLPPGSQRRRYGFGQVGGARGIRTKETVSLGIAPLDTLRWLEGPLLVIQLSSAI